MLSVNCLAKDRESALARSLATASHANLGDAGASSGCAELWQGNMQNEPPASKQIELLMVHSQVI